MTVTQISSIAKKLGVKEPSKMGKKALIQAIQTKEGNAPCYGTGKKACDALTCCWRSDCLA